MYLKKKEKELLLEVEQRFSEWFIGKEEATDDEDYHGADELDECIELIRDYLVERNLLKKI